MMRIELNIGNCLGCPFISIEDGHTPEYEKPVLCIDDPINPYPFIGTYNKDEDGNYWKDEEYSTRDVTHWLPFEVKIYDSPEKPTPTE